MRFWYKLWSTRKATFSQKYSFWKPKQTNISADKLVYDKWGKKSGHLEPLYVIYEQ